VSGTGALHRLLATPRTPGHLGQHVEDARDVGGGHRVGVDHGLRGEPSDVLGVASEVVAIDSQVSHRNPRRRLVMPPVHDEHRSPRSCSRSTTRRPMNVVPPSTRTLMALSMAPIRGPATNRRTVP
jgi:hypothetical protein